MKKQLAFVASFLLVAAAAFGAEQTWTGRISDSKCGKSHPGGEHGQKASDADCVHKCVKEGAKYTFVAGDKVYVIHNQDFADLGAHAGHTVELTGEMTGDEIHVTKIAMKSEKGT